MPLSITKQNEIRVNTVVTGNQSIEASTQLSSGRTFVSWFSDHNPTGWSYQLLDQGGNKVGTERTFSYRPAEVLALANGGFLWCFFDANEPGTNRFKFQEYDAAGDPVMGIRSIPGLAPVSGVFDIIQLSNGNFVATAQYGSVLYGSNFATIGTLNVPPNFAEAHGLLALEQGGFVITYRVSGGASDGTYEFQRFDNSGQKVGTGVPFGYGSTNATFDTPDLIALDDGGFAAVIRRADNSEAKLVLVSATNVVTTIQLPGVAGSFGVGAMQIERLTDETFIVRTNETAQIYHNSGEAVSGVFTGLASLVVTGDGEFTAVKRAEGVAGGFGFDLVAQHYSLNGDPVFGTAGDDQLVGGTGPDMLYGLAGNDTLRGYGGIDELAGGTGDDRLIVDDSADKVIEAVGGGNDTLVMADTLSSYTLAAGQEIERVELADRAPELGNSNFNGNEFGQHIIGNSANNFIEGRGGNDRLEGQGGNDVLRGGDGNDTLLGGAGNDQLRGGKGVDSFDGGTDDGVPDPSFADQTIGDRISFSELDATQGVIADLRTGTITNDGFGNVETMTGIESLGTGTVFADQFFGNDSRNFLYGSTGDTLRTFGGDDSIFLVGAALVADGGAGRDNLMLSHTGALRQDSNGDGLAELAPDMTQGFVVDLQAGSLVDGYGNAGSVENFEAVWGTLLGDVLRGDDLANELRGQLGDDTLDGRGGDDRLNAWAGSDLVSGGNGTDTVDYSELSHFAYYEGFGGVFVDLAIGVARESGVTANRTLDDPYFLYHFLVTPPAGGYDGSVILAEDQLSSIENIVGTGLGDTLYGDNGDNVIAPGAGNDIVDGRGGTDTVDYSDARGRVVVDLALGSAALEGSGAVPADRYEDIDDFPGQIYLEIAADDAAASSDQLISIENASGSGFADQITGDAGANLLRGNGGNDVLIGGAGNDTLEGGLGADQMRGGLGDDIFLVDDAGDLVFELAGEGTDTVRSSVSFSLLGGHVEHLTLLGSAAIDATGNDLANVLTGNSAANRLDGGAGADRMVGGLGDDVYVVDQAGDIVEEAAGEGTDTVNTALSYSLGDNVERLLLTGALSIDGTGNALANTITGNAGNNRLSGGAGDDMLVARGGADSLDGGEGNDTAVLAGTAGSYRSFAIEGQFYLLGTNETVRLTGVETVQFANTSVAASTLQASAPAFDALGYIASNRDLINAFGLNADAATQHYVQYGYTGGWKTDFDPLRYIASNRDLIAAYGLNTDVATQHYILYGSAGGWKTDFDALRYIASNADLIGAYGLNTDVATQHYILYGNAGGWKTDFDALRYIASNADLIAAYGLNTNVATQHYILYGQAGGWKTDFDALRYIASNSDLIDAYGLNTNVATQHYILYGQVGGWKTDFDALRYIASNSDLIAAYGLNTNIATQHYILYGYDGGWKMDFDGAAYLLSYGDLQAAGLGVQGATQHWIVYGSAGERPSGDVLFGHEQASHALNVDGMVGDALATTGDRDWFQITLAAGQKIDLSLDATGFDGTLAVHNSLGRQVVFDNDAGNDTALRFTANGAGTYYLVVDSAAHNGAGTYTISAEPVIG